MKEARPKVSVIIPCYNLGVYLHEAIESVKAQTFTDWELIVINDGSTDKRTNQIFQTLALENPELTFITQKNKGLPATRNIGIEQAQGEYIVCLDADDVLLATYLEKTVRLLDQDKTGKVGFVTTWLREFGERSNLWKAGDFDVPKALVLNPAHVASIFRRKVWEKVGGYAANPDIHGYEDWNFWLSIIEKGYTWKTVPEPLFRYRIRANSMLATSKSKHASQYTALLQLHQDMLQNNLHQFTYEIGNEFSSVYASLREKNDVIEELGAGLDYQKAQVAQAEDKVESLNRSRIMIGAQKLIGVSIFVRSLPSYRYRIRRLVPYPLVRVVRKIRRTIFPVTIETVVNEAWPASKPLVSIVTPFYNQGASVQETIDSVVGQTYRNIEYIIVNDGSDAENSEVLDGVSDPRVSVIHHKQNIGKGSPAAARNSGIEKATGKYIICLDADDALDPTYVEKGLDIMETNPMISLVSTDTQTFGASDDIMTYQPYNPGALISDNMITTAAMYRRAAWEKVGGYKIGIGYEDWEFWINLAEHGYFGQHIPERLFRYRTASESRFIQDRKKHETNLATIAKLHPDYRAKVKSIVKANKRKQVVADRSTLFVNLDDPKAYQQYTVNNNVLLALPWMTFGGAETLIVNFCNAIKYSFNISFVTGLESAHEWEHKFKEISPEIYHLTNLFSDSNQYLEFLSNYITTRNIDLIHIIHTSFMFEYLPELKRRHPNLKVAVTLFNDRAHFEEAMEAQASIDTLTSDNSKVVDHYKKDLQSDKLLRVIPNGINCSDIYNPDNFERSRERATLGLEDDDLAVFFVGRMSSEKNPDVFIDVAKQLVVTNRETKLKFFLVGDGPMTPELQHSIKLAGSPNIVFLGYKSDVARHLSMADIFVLPSSIEGFPLSILEAMAMRVAVIASDVGAVSQVLTTGQDGVVVTPGSVPEIAAAIHDLNADRAKLEKMKTAGRHTLVSKYSDEALGNNYTSMYMDTIKQ